ncbi:hypothetical protein EJ05DRAFT_516625 [Pseudovirgaria hyperparasitica]|uniref:Uncharacterized protein n=1 Tax=Pseudovirgaria hyperparasitica TaxID=470096 RepID=A0A6A6WLW6_9PEZI|nr:uncharacterized protein EJ05DRAFT_516625 [Pseudovirgaria hyperparasitica]KAF2763197.1 hypothetical protein EJ05DRAFT_516625 [Pseudovirgaria hyperparasitica]
MQPTTITIILAYLGVLSTAAVIPVEVEKRTLGDRNDPFQVDVDCSGADAVCNLDCYGILCFLVPNPTQRQIGISATHRQDSGVDARPLYLTEQQRFDRGLNHTDTILNQIGRSPEEITMASSAQGGSGDILGPTQVNQNEEIGSRISGQLSHLGVGDRQWYFRRFTNYAHAPYCDALQASPPDHSVCPEDGKDDTDPARISFVRMDARGPNNRIQYHMMSFNAGDRWTGKNWARVSKREDEEVNEEDPYVIKQ